MNEGRMLRVMRSSENLTALALHVCLLVKASASALAALPWVRPTHTHTHTNKLVLLVHLHLFNLPYHWSSNAQLMWVILLCRVETTMSQKWIPKTASWVLTMLFHAGCINENHPLKNITLILRKLKECLSHCPHTLGMIQCMHLLFFVKAFCG